MPTHEPRIARSMSLPVPTFTSHMRTWMSCGSDMHPFLAPVDQRLLKLETHVEPRQRFGFTNDQHAPRRHGATHVIEHVALPFLVEIDEDVAQQCDVESRSAIKTFRSEERRVGKSVDLGG